MSGAKPSLCCLGGFLDDIYAHSVCFKEAQLVNTSMFRGRKLFNLLSLFLSIITKLICVSEVST